ncbi:MAG: lipopolysaccharide biosynthesis protein RfbH [Proteobacteria bacterium]|nr:lipopolysaccharide biosynthesis protein RfbH [Pseudomonadota bacterium]HQR04004.1 lipopolysaccharide biosynthesis protein RfbH [Rhodocyclaceae bacterium]
MSVSRDDILALVRQYASDALVDRGFTPGKTAVPPSGKSIVPDDIAAVVDAALDGWFTTGRHNAAFETALGQYLGLPHVLTTNSGSSANLLAVSALTSPLLGERQLQPGDEVITAAAGFPTTVNPLLQNGLVPVFVDSAPPHYNPVAAAVEAAIGPRTRAIVLAHTLGNPYEVQTLRSLADRHGLWLVEDCCDALGSIYTGRKVGTFGHIGTLSFYPAHHITMGEGGAVFTADPLLRRILESFRDWGRDCWCAPGADNTCGKRFDWQLGDLPAGYDHKYTYRHAGYNLKITDMQAALGFSQLGRIDAFIQARREHFRFLHQALAPLAEVLELPQATAESNPSWFGFPLTLRPAAGCRRVDLLRYLDERRIGTRLLFAGNLVRQPYFAGRPYRISGTLEGADRIMNDSFWIGLHPGLDTDQLAYSAEQLLTFFGHGF